MNNSKKRTHTNHDGERDISTNVLLIGIVCTCDGQALGSLEFVNITILLPWIVDKTSTAAGNSSTTRMESCFHEQYPSRYDSCSIGLHTSGWQLRQLHTIFAMAYTMWNSMNTYLYKKKTE